MQRASGGKVEEKQGGFRIHGEVTEAVEEIVARVIGPPQPVPVGADDTGWAAAVGRVSAPFGVRGAEEEGIGGPDQLQVFRLERAALANVIAAGPVAVFGCEKAVLNVLRAVAVGLLDFDEKKITAAHGEGAVDAHPAPGGEFDRRHPHLLACGQPVQWVSCGDHGMDRDGGFGRHLQEPGFADQWGRPELSGGIPTGDDEERSVAEESRDAARQGGGLKHSGQASRI